ncbi:MAG: FAD-dependent oxidoreductase [Limnochordaceae bacterium]|nr:FAD-dependent oxidoreductase [Limnochordaceae bacterium]
MDLLEPAVHVVVIGGGATGVSAAWALAQRGLTTVLVERTDWAAGTSGRNHGLLHSGARYAVKDPKAAWECWQENQRIRRLFPDVVDPCGGLFVALTETDSGYLNELEIALKGLGIPHQRLSGDEARTLEPELSPAVVAALAVPDASVNPFRLVARIAARAEEAGAHLYPGWQVTGLSRPQAPGGRWRVELLGGDGRRAAVEAQAVVNAGGPWAAHLAELAGETLPMQPMAGSLLVYASRPVRRVINRSRPPADGDILVPGGPVLVAGTTSRPVGTAPEELDPPGLRVLPWEVHLLRREAEAMLPALADTRLLRAFVGVRPLPAGKGSNDAAGREASRDFQVEAGESGFFSVIGGKLTTSLLLGEAVAGRVSHYLGVGDVHKPLSGHAGGRAGGQAARRSKVSTYSSFTSGGQRLAGKANGAMICECEWLREGELVDELRQSFGRVGFEGARRRGRLGAGPCQGLVCSLRLPGLAWQAMGVPLATPDKRQLDSSAQVDQIWDQWLQFVRRRWLGVGLVQADPQAQRALHEADLVYTEMMGLPPQVWRPLVPARDPLIPSAQERPAESRLVQNQAQRQAEGKRAMA